MTHSTDIISPAPALLSDLGPIGQLAILCLRGIGQRETALRDRLARQLGHDQARTIIARADDILAFLSQRAPVPIHRAAPDIPGLTRHETLFAELVEAALDNHHDNLFAAAMALCGANMAPCLIPLATAFALTLARARATLARADQSARGCPHLSPLTQH